MSEQGGFSVEKSEFRDTAQTLGEKPPMEQLVNIRDFRPLGSGKPSSGRRCKRNREANRLPPFVPLTSEMLNHEAYKALTPSAAKALPYFLAKVKISPNDPQSYESEFYFT